MSGLLSITITEARGATAPPADIDNLAVVIGVSSAGSGLSPFFLSGSSAVDAVGFGDAVDDLTQIIEQRQDGAPVPKVPAAIYSTPADTPGAYGPIDQSGLTGPIVVVAGATAPYGTYQAALRVVNGGVVGIDTDITLRWSLDGLRNTSSVTALGTASQFIIPNSNVTFVFEVDPAELTVLDTLLNDLKATYNIHRVDTAGGIHTTSDVTNSVTAADAVDSATRIALANDLRTQYEAHRVLVGGGPVHLGPDNTNVITAPVATDDLSALILGLDLLAAYEAHRVLTTGPVHGAPDNTNVITAPAPVGPTLADGDTVGTLTSAPQPGATEIADAFEALAQAGVGASLFFVEVDCDSTLAATVSTGLNRLAEVGIDATAIVRTRIRDFNTGETEIAWGAAIEADFKNFEDSRIVVRASYQLITDALATRQYLRSDLAQFGADIVRVGRFVWPASPNDRAMPNASIVDADGNEFGHDEGPRGVFTGLSDNDQGNLLSCIQRLPDITRREDVFNTVPWTMAAPDDQAKNLMIRRLLNAMRRIVRSLATPNLGSIVFFEKTGPTTANLTARSRKAIQATIYGPLRAEFSNEINNADEGDIDAGLVQVATQVTVSGTNLVTVPITLAPEIGGFVLSIPITIAIQE